MAMAMFDETREGVVRLSGPIEILVHPDDEGIYIMKCIAPHEGGYRWLYLSNTLNYELTPAVTPFSAQDEIDWADYLPPLNPGA